MTSSTAPSNGTRFRSSLGVLALTAAMFVCAYLMFEATSYYAESRLSAYLWKQQDYLRVFSPVYHVGRGPGRLLIMGNSEAREALLPEELRRELPDVKPYQNAQSMATTEDALVVLNYIEGAYGPTAIPDELLIGITTKFVSGIRLQPSPLFNAIRKYSPHFTLVEDASPPSLVPKTALQSALSRVRLLALQPDRYRRGMVAIGISVGSLFVPSVSAYERLILPSKHFTGRIFTPAESRDFLTAPGELYDVIHKWDPGPDRGRVTRELRLLLDFTARHRIRVYFVNMPEVSWNRDLYLPGRYEAYLDIVRSTIGDTPFLDLRTFLRDDEYYDEAHATASAGIRVSNRVAAFIRAERETRGWSRGGT